MALNGLRYPQSHDHFSFYLMATFPNLFKFGKGGKGVALR